MFDRYFADQRPGWRRRALMGASIALHAGLAALVLGVTWSQVESAPREVPLTFFAPPPPPPAASSAAKATPPKTKPRVLRPDRLVRRSRTMDKTPREQPAEPDGVAGGVAGGVKGGVVGGTGGSSKVIPQFMADKERLTAPDPHLPEWFRQQHPRQSVTGLYRVCVDNDGRVVAVQVVNGIAGVDGAITQQVLASWRYKPQTFPFCSPRVFRFDIN